MLRTVTRYSKPKPQGTLGLYITFAFGYCLLLNQKSPKYSNESIIGQSEYFSDLCKTRGAVTSHSFLQQRSKMHVSSHVCSRLPQWDVAKSVPFSYSSIFIYLWRYIVCSKGKQNFWTCIPNMIFKSNMRCIVGVIYEILCFLLQ